jgi:hypothetical protein
MAERRGESFNELDEADTRLVTIAAAIVAGLEARAGASATDVSVGSSESLWQRSARLEALRA